MSIISLHQHTYLSVLDLVLVLVLWSRSVFANILVFSELIDEYLAAVPPVSLREAELSSSLLDGKRELSK